MLPRVLQPRCQVVERVSSSDVVDLQPISQNIFYGNDSKKLERRFGNINIRLSCKIVQLCGTVAIKWSVKLVPEGLRQRHGNKNE